MDELVLDEICRRGWAVRDGIILLYWPQRTLIARAVLQLLDGR